MSLTDEERKILVGLEIEKSRRTFAEIEILRQAGLGDNIANNSKKPQKGSCCCCKPSNSNDS